MSNLENTTANIGEPLVSIIVITYNSAKYILQTLESIKAQTYNNLELIISDDCSSDDTLALCREWIDTNPMLLRPHLLTINQNTGISSNCNRGLKQSHGIWIKFIAGDDLIVPNAIENFITFTESPDQEISFAFGGCQLLIDDKVDDKVLLPSPRFIMGTAREQYVELITSGNCIHGPTAFFRKQTLLDIGGFDERIRLSEDWPIYIKATKQGHKLFFLQDCVAYYRVHEDGIYSKTLKKLQYDKRLNNSVNKIRALYLLPLLKNEGRWIYYWHTFIIYKKETYTENRLLYYFYYFLQLSDPIFLKRLFIKINRLPIQYLFL